MAASGDPGAAATAERPVPVTVFTGFVGSGKTTMILRYATPPPVGGVRRQRECG